MYQMDADKVVNGDQILAIYGSFSSFFFFFFLSTTPLCFKFSVVMEV